MIDALKNGDAGAFEKVFSLYKQKVFAYFLKKTNAEEDAKDLLQITFSKLWQYRSSLSADYLLEQHLFHIARTVFIDYLRKENKQQKVKTTAKLHTTEKLSADSIHEFDLYARFMQFYPECLYLENVFLNCISLKVILIKRLRKFYLFLLRRLIIIFPKH